MNSSSSRKASAALLPRKSIDELMSNLICSEIVVDLVGFGALTGIRFFRGILNFTPLKSHCAVWLSGYNSSITPVTFESEDTTCSPT